jgi:hypothetical protein
MAMIHNDFPLLLIDAAILESYISKAEGRSIFVLAKRTQ